MGPTAGLSARSSLVRLLESWSLVCILDPWSLACSSVVDLSLVHRWSWSSICHSYIVRLLDSSLTCRWCVADLSLTCR